MKSLKPYKILSRQTVINEPYCHIEKQRVEFPNGEEGDWFLKINNDAVIVLPILPGGRVLLQKTYKHGGGQIITECCAGLMDEGEGHPIETAKRELLEETGYASNKWTHLGSTLANATTSSMKYHFFLAEECIKIAEQQLESAEQIELVEFENIQAAQKHLTDPKEISTAAVMALLAYL